MCNLFLFCSLFVCCCLFSAFYVFVCFYMPNTRLVCQTFADLEGHTHVSKEKLHAFSESLRS